MGRALAPRLPALQVGASGIAVIAMIAHLLPVPQGVPAPLPIHPKVRGSGGGVAAATGQVWLPRHLLPSHLLPFDMVCFSLEVTSLQKEALQLPWDNRLIQNKNM